MQVAEFWLARGAKADYANDSSIASIQLLIKLGADLTVIIFEAIRNEEVLMMDHTNFLNFDELGFSFPKAVGEQAIMLGLKTANAGYISLFRDVLNSIGVDLKRLFYCFFS